MSARLLSNKAIITNIAESVSFHLYRSLIGLMQTLPVCESRDRDDITTAFKAADYDAAPPTLT